MHPYVHPMQHLKPGDHPRQLALPLNEYAPRTVDFSYRWSTILPWLGESCA